jgi:hypothetical protein
METTPATTGSNLPAKLPTLQDLMLEPEEAFKHDVFNQLMNNPPPKKWVKQHPFIRIEDPNGSPNKVNLPYLPIDKVEFLLTRIFQQWRTEVIEFKQLFNSVSVHVRVHYRHPVSGQWEFHDGLGAVGVQTDKGASASDLNAIKQDSVMKALPAAKSYAIKDAAEHLGKMFGRDLTRKDTVAFTASYTSSELLNAHAVSIPETQQS